MTDIVLTSPPNKRIKLESTSPVQDVPRYPFSADTPHEHDEDSGDNCSICLQPISDRTVIATCSHEFCFECLLIWTDQSRRCPLCSQSIGEYLIHHIRSKYDYQKHYLAPLRTSPKPQNAVRRQAQLRREHEWGRRQRRVWEEADELQRAIERRRWIYRQKLYAKHVASNTYTRYRPFPTPAQFAADPALISRATAFIRRELNVWVGLDVEFLTMFTLSLIKSLDIRSEPAVRLLAEFLDMDSGGSREKAEQFAHELYCYLRSPFRDLAVYDTVVQYDIPEGVPPPDTTTRRPQWDSREYLQSPAPPPLPSRSPSPTRSQRRSSGRSRLRNRSFSRSSPRRSLERDTTQGSGRASSRRRADRSPTDRRRYHEHTSRARTPRSPSRSPDRREEPRELRDRSRSRNDSSTTRETSRTINPSSYAPGFASTVARASSSPQVDRKGKRRAHLRLSDRHQDSTTEDQTNEGPPMLRRPTIYGSASEPSHPHATQSPGNAAVIDFSKPDTAADPSNSASGDQPSGVSAAASLPTWTLAAEPRAQPLPRPRSRNLMQEVRAHLAVRDAPPRVRKSHSGNQGPQIELGREAAPPYASDHSSGDAERVQGLPIAQDVPSLLRRLSDPSDTVHNAPTEDLRSLYSPSTATDASAAGNKRSSRPVTDETHGTIRGHILATLRPSEGRSLHPRNPEQEAVARRPAGIQDTDNDSASTALRDKLLSRLAGEKSVYDSLLAHSGSAQPDGGSSSAGSETVSMAVAAGDERSHDEVDSDGVGTSSTREAVLRSQAQLRARLVREKLAARSGDSGNR